MTFIILHVGPLVGVMARDRDSEWYQRLRLPFWNQDENRFRAFWRILAALFVALVVPSLLTAVVVRPLDLPFALVNLVSNGIAALVALGVLVGWAQYVDQRERRAYGFNLTRRWWRTLALGTLVGLVGWGGALATDLAFGWASITAVFSPGTDELPFLVSLLLFALTYLFVGFWEETIFRGIVMRNAVEGLTVASVSHRVALAGGWVSSSVLFGILHFRQATSPLALAFWILAGLILGLAYLLTDELAIPIGLHFAFDFSANNVFGLANVRTVASDVPMVLRPTFSGPDAVVGLSGVVNTSWLVVIGVLTVGVIKWQYGSLRPRIDPYSRSGG
jgi:membrane protease YdiL (CAAX protease family)